MLRPSRGGWHIIRLFAAVMLVSPEMAGLGRGAVASEPQERADAGRSGAGSARLVSWQGGGRTAPLTYRFRAGQTFAYNVEITYSPGGTSLSETFRGTPYIRVQSVDEEGEAELFVIGKLECFLVDGAGETRRPQKDVWLGSRRATGRNGGSIGKPDLNLKALPGFFKLLDLNPRELIIPPVPEDVPSLNKWTGTAMMFASRRSSTGLVGLSTTPIDGEMTRLRQADVLQWPLVRLTGAKLFDTKPGQKAKVHLKYRTSGTFDASLGLLRALDMSYREESGGLAIVAGAKVRLIEAQDALMAAYKTATAVWAERPEGFSPVEFKRVRIKPFLPEHLKSASQARPGTWLYHLRGTSQQLPDADNRYYVAEVLGPGRKGTVSIRYQGSKEELDVSPGTLAFPVSADHPGPGRVAR